MVAIIPRKSRSGKFEIGRCEECPWKIALHISQSQLVASGGIRDSEQFASGGAPFRRETRRHRVGGFLRGGDNYFCGRETRGEGGNDRVHPVEIYVRREDGRFHDGHHCFVYITDRIRSSDGRVWTINNHGEFRNDRYR